MAEPSPVRVLCIYRVKDGQEDEFRPLLEKHWPTLNSIGLVTSEPARWYASKDKKGRQLFLEIFEWKDGGAHAAHTNSNVMEIWDGMGAVADFVPLGDLAEAGTRFPHFLPLEGGTP